MEPKFKTLGTHSGVFHADEVHGAMLLLNYVAAFRGAKLVRTRDQGVLDSLDIVIDVGLEYNADKLRFDHHQKGFHEVYDPKSFNRVKLSASGLVFKHFGPEIVRAAVQALFEEERLLEPEHRRPLSAELVEVLCRKLYEKYFEFLDGVDNGQSRIPKGTKTLYRWADQGLAHQHH